MTRSKEKLLKAFIYIFVIAFGFLFFKNNVYANEIKVYLNGEELSYTEAQPQIINDRTMVPLTETAEHFNMTSTWDADISTMYFNGNNRALIHTVYSNVIYVDGTLISYDFTSTIDNDRTLMPIRMIAEALGCEVEWKQNEAAVYITADINTHGENQLSQTSTISEQTVAPIASLYSASLESSTVEIEDYVYINVTGNFATTKVKAEDEYGNILAESSSYDTDDTANYFQLKFTVDTEGSHTLNVYGGTAAGYNSTARMLTLTVKSAGTDIEITSISAADDEIDTGDTVTLTVKTTTDVAKVTVYNSDDERLATKSSPSSTASSTYTWKLSFSESDNTGTVKYYVYAYDENGESVYDTISIYVNKTSSSSSSTPIIEDVDYDSDVEYGDRITIAVETNSAVGSVYIYDPDNDEIAYLTSYSSKSGSTYYWNLKFYIYDEGYYYIYAYDEDEDDYDYEKIYIYVD